MPNFDVFVKGMYGTIGAVIGVAAIGLLIKLVRTWWNIRNSSPDNKDES